MKTTLKRGHAAGLLMALVALPAAADDGLSALENGALVFGQSKTIAMSEETLTVSASKITADFHFVNKGSAPETITIAFPIPAIDTANNEGFYIPVEDQDNFVGFTTTIDGMPMVNRLEQRAFAPDGSEVTALLKKFNVPLVRPNWVLTDLIPTLPKRTQQALVKAGALKQENGDLWPQWVTKSKFYFQQTFEPGKPVHIVHSYKPSLDTTNISFYSSVMEPSEDQKALYCLKDETKAAVVALEKTKVGQEFPYATQSWLSYILSTAKTWAGPIGHYHLIIDSEKPEVVASFCGEARRTSPTRFEFEQDNYVPDRDLDIIFFQ
jgi:hypothetical protein